MGLDAEDAPVFIPALHSAPPQPCAFLQRFPQRVWPTLTILDASSEKPLLRSLGSPTVGELLGLLEDGLRAASAELEGPDRLLAEADRLHATGEAEKAAEAFEKALAEASKTSEPEIRAIYDSHRLLASLLLETPERMIAALQESERAAPHDYNAPARLALVYQRLGRFDEALAANERALARVYGPRKARVLNDRGAILAAKGEQEEARTAYAAAIEWAEGLPPGQRPDWEIRRARAALDELGVH